MRKKEPKPLGVADGFSFDSDDFMESNFTEELSAENTLQKISNVRSSDSTPQVTERIYSKYYTPKPKTGAKGGVIGRGPVKESERKVQFSVTCTPSQKETYQKAAVADGRKLPDFVNRAIQEYIDNHNLH